MTKYLIEFILNFIVGLVMTIFLPFVIFLTHKDMRIRKKIREGTFSYLHSFNKESRTKMIFIYLSQVAITAVICCYLFFIQIPIIRDVPALITGNFLLAEGTVTNIEHNRAYNTIYINNTKIQEDTWFTPTIKQYNKYKISYLKHSKSIIKIQKLD
ncbi:hypothetical protein JK636_07245 [Clostridium sp. YIM B02515]|uniref:Uncharacterized protein n=1 Tax=Clostridium rhizosphaerae TaxID=2803861 RepID=A0ABS1T878_9CLOT|nr:hypothetical protein [Clostridium rhizosphaerae]MBL4935553.1 hypothetical protein [Clostridium rhizosphaerae]